MQIKANRNIKKVKLLIKKIKCLLVNERLRFRRKTRFFKFDWSDGSRVILTRRPFQWCKTVNESIKLF